MNTFLSFDDLIALARPRYLLRPMIEMGSVGMLFGEPGAGKTFVSLDLALTIASGGTWAGMAARQLPVVYVSAEGGDAIGRRVRAWYLEAMRRLPSDEARQALIDALESNFHVIPHSVQVAESTARHQLVEDIRAIHGPETPIGLIVLDTLARNAVGLEENSNTDMGMFVDACYSLRSALKVAPSPLEAEDDDEMPLDDAPTAGEPVILIVHHTGKQALAADGSPVERGASALRGGMDFQLALDAGPPLRLLTVKLKDGAKPEPMAVLWSDPVIVGYDWDEKKHITSLVLMVQPAGSALSPAEDKLEKRRMEDARLEHQIISEMQRDPTQSIRDIAARLDVGKTRVADRVKWLVSSGRVKRENGLYLIGREELLEPLVLTPD